MKLMKLISFIFPGQLLLSDWDKKICPQNETLPMITAIYKNDSMDARLHTLSDKSMCISIRDVQP